MVPFTGISRLYLGISPFSNARFVPYKFILSRGFSCRLFVGGISTYTTDKSLYETFAQFGEVIEAKIVIDRVSNKSKGFGFVTFTYEDEAQKALTEMNGKVLNGRSLFVDKAFPKSKSLFHDSAPPIARGPPDRDF